MDKRLFLAVLPDDAARNALVATQRLVAPHIAKPKPTAANNLHVTLAFLGNCDATQEEAAKHSLQKAAAASHTFELALGQLGCFGKHHGGSIVWRGVDGDVAALHALHNQLVDALADEGFDLGNASYIPHITLFRGARPTDKNIPLAETLDDLNGQPNLTKQRDDERLDGDPSAGDAIWPVRSASLMWSHRPAETGQLTYDEIAHVDLTGTL